MRSYEDSMQRLGLNRIDLLLIHDLDCWHHENEDIFLSHLSQLLSSGWRALEELRDSDCIRGVGAGVNIPGVIPRFLDAMDLDLFIVAMPYTLLDQGALDVEFPLCEERGVGVVIGAVFASGILATGPVEGAVYGYRPASGRQSTCSSFAAMIGVGGTNKHSEFQSQGLNNLQRLSDLAGWLALLEVNNEAQACPACHRQILLGDLQLLAPRADRGTELLWIPKIHITDREHDAIAAACQREMLPIGNISKHTESPGRNIPDRELRRFANLSLPAPGSLQRRFLLGFKPQMARLSYPPWSSSGNKKGQAKYLSQKIMVGYYWKAVKQCNSRSRRVLLDCP